MNETLIAILAFVATLVVAWVRSKRALIITPLAVSLGLAPALWSVNGIVAMMTLIAWGGLTASVAFLGQWIGRRKPALGIDLLSALAPSRSELFGPTVLRLATCFLAVLPASWFALNVQANGSFNAHGVVFALADLWLIGAARLLRAVNEQDLAIAVTTILLVTAAGILVFEVQDANLDAWLFAASTITFAGVASWALGRYQRRSLL